VDDIGARTAIDARREADDRSERPAEARERMTTDDLSGGRRALLGTAVEEEIGAVGGVPDFSLFDEHGVELLRNYVRKVAERVLAHMPDPDVVGLDRAMVSVLGHLDPEVLPLVVLERIQEAMKEHGVEAVADLTPEAMLSALAQLGEATTSEELDDNEF